VEDVEVLDDLGREFARLGVLKHHFDARRDDADGVVQLVCNAGRQRRERCQLVVLTRGPLQVGSLSSVWA
jgi:hypothetical protein